MLKMNWLVVVDQKAYASETLRFVPTIHHSAIPSASLSHIVAKTGNLMGFYVRHISVDHFSAGCEAMRSLRRFVSNILIGIDAHSHTFSQNWTTSGGFRPEYSLVLLRKKSNVRCTMFWKFKQPIANYEWIKLTFPWLSKCLPIHVAVWNTSIISFRIACGLFASNPANGWPVLLHPCSPIGSI